MSYFLYNIHEIKNTAMYSANFWAENMKDFWQVAGTDDPLSRILEASSELFVRTTKVYEKPGFNIHQTRMNNVDVSIKEKIILDKPFCSLVHFEKKKARKIQQPKILVVAPLSGHYASLLRGTVEGLLPYHDVYVTDWKNARDVPYSLGTFTLDDYIDYLLDFFRTLGDDFHVLAVCQPAVPVLAAVSLLAMYNEPYQPKSMILMGGPIDTRINPGPVNEFASETSLEWMRENMITQVPPIYEGYGRDVLPGFLMLNGFMSLNMARHQEAFLGLFEKLVEGDESSAESHKKFYDEYRAVMDITADYYLDSIRVAFQDHDLPKGKMKWRGHPITPKAITKTALFTIEGEKDDISPVGQTYAAHGLCPNIPVEKHEHYIQKGVGHYGIFNGRKWLNMIRPKITEFILKNS